jgi:predicted RNA-binding Zn-ribbon protein involved in translation (DUF1610 family)
MPFTAAIAEKNINYRIEHQCPQCGAPAIIEETDRLVTCEYCRVSSYLIPEDVFRYLLPHKAPTSEDILYFPYWRMKGMLFSCIEDGLSHRYMDVSHQAIASDTFPASVGLRSQALKLTFMSVKGNSRFLKPSLSLKHVMKLFQNRFGGDLAEPVFYRNIIGETISLIYSPFYGNKQAVDAVINEPLARPLTEPFVEKQFDDSAANWQIQFLPTLCPHCGWSLAGEKDAVVMVCKNCSSAWRPGKNGFKRLKIAYMPAKEDPVVYLPFWRIKADIEGIRLTTYEDLVHRANLPKVVQPGWDKKIFYFWNTAFKVRPNKFLRLATNITIAQPQEELVFDLPKQKLFSPNLPLKDAIDGIKPNLANFIRPTKNFFPKLNDITITPKSFLLVWIPFVDKHQEYIQPHYQVSILKNHLNLARSL